MKRIVLLFILILLLLSVSFGGQTMIGGGAKLGGQHRASRNPRPGGTLVVDGNSLPNGFTLDGQESKNLATILKRRLDAAYGANLVTFYLVAEAGLNTEDMISRAATFVDNHFSAGQHCVLVSWEGVNSVVLHGDTVDQAYAAYQSYGSARKAVGWYHVVVTMSATPWVANDPPLFLGDWENTKRYQFDTKLRTPSDLGVNWDAVADLAADPTIAANVQTHGAQTAHTENFQSVDDVHQSIFGYPYEADAIFPLLAAPFGFPAPTTLAAKLKAVFPLWNPALPISPGSAPDYWGNNHVNLGPGSIQSADYVTFPNNGGAQTNTAVHTLHARATGFFVSAWFRPTQLEAAHEQRLGGVADWNLTNQNEYLVYIPEGGHLTFKVWEDDVTTHTVTSAVNLVNNNWYFYIASYDGTNISLSVNNETPVTTAVSTIKTNSSSTFRMSTDNGANVYTGDMRWVLYGTIPLSSTERAYLYNGGTARTTLF